MGSVIGVTAGGEVGWPSTLDDLSALETEAGDDKGAVDATSLVVNKVLAEIERGAVERVAVEEMSVAVVRTAEVDVPARVSVACVNDRVPWILAFVALVNAIVLVISSIGGLSRGPGRAGGLLTGGPGLGRGPPGPPAPSGNAPII
ncbi:uncharacterized protein PG998_001474 [Apiospora kogelbergensis]|uniref:Uncharacterized protein n=1 Tax=Apiospora kogelbergensis TaxID=1337665 RepID=A0AAW0QRV8_9PEZI